MSDSGDASMQLMGYVLSAKQAPLPTAQPTVKLLTKKPVRASPEEASANPRSRSAKLRAVEKL